MLALSPIRHSHNQWWRIADDVLCLFIPRARTPFSMGEENIIFADRAHVISKEFKVLEDKIDAKFASYRIDLHELAREPVTRENLDMFDLPGGCAPTVGCAEQPSPTVVRAAGVGSDTQGEFQPLKDSLSRLKLPSELKLNESRQGIQRTDHAVYNVLIRCALYSETSLRGFDPLVLFLMNEIKIGSYSFSSSVIEYNSNEKL